MQKKKTSKTALSVFSVAFFFLENLIYYCVWVVKSHCPLSMFFLSLICYRVRCFFGVFLLFSGNENVTDLLAISKCR